jgi:hypothetical protein
MAVSPVLQSNHGYKLAEVNTSMIQLLQHHPQTERHLGIVRFAIPYIVFVGEVFVGFLLQKRVHLIGTVQNSVRPFLRAC